MHSMKYLSLIYFTICALFLFCQVPLLVDGLNILKDSSGVFIFGVVSLKRVLHSNLLFVDCLAWEMRHCTPCHAASHSPKLYNNTIVKTSNLSSSYGEQNFHSETKECMRCVILKPKGVHDFSPGPRFMVTGNGSYYLEPSWRMSVAATSPRRYG
jgi:hypothetical protein